jgi:hypothetical protein
VVGEKVKVCGGLVEGRVRCCRRRASGRICVVGEKRRQWDVGTVKRTKRCDLQKSNSKNQRGISSMCKSRSTDRVTQ